MSVFSETLRNIIQEHNIVITRLAQSAELDRTTLQHILSGKRMPNREQVDKLLYVITVPPREKTQLLQAYEITQHGTDKFRSRKKVKEIIEKLTSVPASRLNLPSFSPVSPADPEGNAIEALYGTPAINNVITRILHEEEEEVVFFMPPGFTFFYDSLLARFAACPTLSATCLLSLPNAKSSTMPNLEYLEDLIPLFALAKQDFQAHYIYDDNFSYGISATPLPYFVFTSRYILPLSAEQDFAILTNSESAMQIYRSICQNFISLSRPLYTTPTLPELIAAYSQQQFLEHPLCFIENQPNFQWYLTEHILQKCFIPESEEYASLISQYKEFLAKLRRVIQPFGVFGQEGLNLFVDTGRIAIWPPALTRPLDVSDRTTCLQHMIRDVESDTFPYRLVNSAKFTIPHHAISIGIKGNSLLISCFDYVTPNLKNICLTEEFILDAFTDFFQQLPNSDLVHSKEETLKVLNAALEKLKGKSGA